MNLTEEKGENGQKKALSENDNHGEIKEEKELSDYANSLNCWASFFTFALEIFYLL